jgi:hypothetical protein
MADWWEKPFKVEVDGQPWAVLTDRVFLIGIQGGNKLPLLENAPPGILEGVLRMLRMKPEGLRTTPVESLREFLKTDEYAYLLGVPLNTQRLLRVISKTKEPEIDLWDASKFFQTKCLGLVAQPKWRAFLMGVTGLGDVPPVPVYEFEVTPEDLFKEVMGEG